MPDSEAFGDVGVDTFGHIAYTVKTMEIPNLKKLGMLNLHPTKDMQFAAFGAAIKAAFFVVSVKQKREFCWRFSTFSSTLEEKGEMLLERPVFSFFSKLIMPLFYDKKFLRGRWFEESSLGWTWCWRNLWMQKVKGINRDIPFPVSFRNEVSSAENLIFDPDDMNDFNAFGCYFQNFARQNRHWQRQLYRAECRSCHGEPCADRFGAASARQRHRARQKLLDRYEFHRFARRGIG